MSFWRSPRHLRPGEITARFRIKSTARLPRSRKETGCFRLRFGKTVVKLGRGDSGTLFDVRSANPRAGIMNYHNAEPDLESRSGGAAHCLVHRHRTAFVPQCFRTVVLPGGRLKLSTRSPAGRTAARHPVVSAQIHIAGASQALASGSGAERMLAF